MTTSFPADSSDDSTVTPSSCQLDPHQQIELALDCWYITGATASGKTDISIRLAQRLDAEIISLDSMALYRGMDVGTAKPSPEQRAQIPHHMLDVLDPIESFSVNQYRDQAVSLIQQIRSRGKQVVFVGGTALYLKALLRGLFSGPPADWEFRNQIEDELKSVGESVGLQKLHERLTQIDPLSAHKLHPNDKRRMIRALEVYHVTGSPISHLQNEFEEGHSSDVCKVFTLRHERSVLHERIAQRVDWMFSHGLVEEVQQLLSQWGELGQTASQAVGYREVIEHLQSGTDWETTKQQVLFRTRQFARHQETWFRGLSECRILDLPLEFDGDTLVEQIVAESQMGCPSDTTSTFDRDDA